MLFFLYNVIRHGICRRIMADVKQWVLLFYDFFPLYFFFKSLIPFSVLLMQINKTNDINRKFYFISRALDDRGHF